MLLCEWKVKGEIASGNSPGFQPKLMTCVRNVAFLGETPKTTLQEVVLALHHDPIMPHFIRKSMNLNYVLHQRFVFVPFDTTMMLKVETSKKFLNDNPPAERGSLISPPKSDIQACTPLLSRG
jgi:hypothetical protein